MEILGFIVLIACLVIGVRFGGLGLAAVSGIGLTFFVFVVGLVPGKPPIDVMLTIMAVVTCSGFLQASKGLDVMLKYAEKLLRKNPKQITVLAPITTWFLTVLCGTGHVVYTMFPIIYDIAIKQNIRPERPMAAASVASQMGICASPACCSCSIHGGNASRDNSSIRCGADFDGIYSSYVLRCFSNRLMEFKKR